MVARLGVHVVGPRYGESIVLELPDGGIGIIDSFADRAGVHPLVGFLAARFPTLKQLRFFALTHPHADHCFRSAEIIDRFPPEEVWVFRPFPQGQIQEYYTALKRLETADHVEEALRLPPGSMAISLLQLDQRIAKPIMQGKIHYRPLAHGAAFSLSKQALRVHFLTPGNRLQFAYAHQVESAAMAMLADGPSLAAAGKLPQPDHNLASCGILLEYDATRILLMADAEQPLWTECLANGLPEALHAPVHFLKASHHGSDNGYHSPLYARVADPDVTIAVVTPFHSGRVRLPSAAGVQAIQPHVRDLYCTNRTAAGASTGLTWDAVAPAILPRVPGRWVAMTQRNAPLSRLLVPEAGVPARRGVPPPLPTEWIDDAHQDADLWQLIRPDHRLPTASPATADAHVISAYFDHRGNLLDFQVGAGAGRLRP